MTAPTDWPPTEPLALTTKYELDPFQKHAVVGIHAGDHVFVTAKTGSGKTFVGEYLIARALAAGGRVFYTTPIKSLSNQKYHDLKRLFPHATVGILTGDIKMCPDAQIVVMTAEILRNLFYKRGTATEGVGATALISLEGVVGVVMDEVHYIQDPDRGHVWEETLILCPRHLQLVLLSATMPSAAALAGWMAALHGRRTWLLSTTYRVVPLVHGVLSRSWTVVPLMDVRGNWIGDAYTGWLRDRKAVEDAATNHKRAVDARRADGYASGPVSAAKGARVEDPVARLRRTVRWLQETDQLPALFFVFSRRECERLAALVEGTLLDSSDSAAAAHIVDFHLSRYRDVLERSPQYHTIRALLLRGIAFHHSGLQPLLKEAVELLFARGLVRVLFATETFSVGLNMPTRTVVFLELEKWADGGQRRLLRPDEYIQMAGRAGRRGLDAQGLVLYEPLKPDAVLENYELRGLLTGALPALESRMRFHYGFVLRHYLTGGRVPLAEQSYWAQQQRSARSGLTTTIAALEAQVAAKKAVLSEEMCAALEERAEMAAAATTASNARHKKLVTALRRWDDEHDGPTWTRAATTWKEWREVREELRRRVEEAAAWDAAPLLSLEPMTGCLREWGFLGSEGEELTVLGRAATEVNEGHCILMPMLAASGLMDDVPAEEIPVILAAFLQEGDGGVSEELLEDIGTGRTKSLETMVSACLATERAHRVVSPSTFWELSRVWPWVVAEWQEGRSVAEIAVLSGLFEGNVQRGLLRVANLLEEWATMAEIHGDLATLEKVRSLTFLRGEIVVDSLYLRL